MEPVYGTNNTCCTKIIICTNHILKDFLLSPKFGAYVNHKQILLAYTNLETALPVNVGILEQTTQLSITTVMHTESLCL
jgi:hypothetical protein